MKQRDRINYKQEYIDQLVEKIELVILNNHLYKGGISKAVIKEFKKGLEYLKIGGVYAEVIDYCLDLYGNSDTMDEEFFCLLKDNISECKKSLLWINKKLKRAKK